MKTWTKEVIRELKRRFPYELTRELAESMGIPYEALKKQASRLGLRKSRRHIRSVRRAR